MALERRGEYRYYYRSVRVGRKVKRDYLGSGAEADLAAQAAGLARDLRRSEAEARRLQQAAYIDAITTVERLSAKVDCLTKATLVAAGYYLHGVEWRRRRFNHGGGDMPATVTIPPRTVESRESASAEVTRGAAPNSDPATTKSDATNGSAQRPAAQRTLADDQAFKALVQRANGGDPEAVQLLRKTLDANPQIWQQLGNLAAHAELMLVELIAGEDRLLAESLRRHIAGMKRDLTGEGASSLESLAVQRVVACWLQVQRADASAIAASGTPAAKFWVNEQHRADRRYQASVRQLLNIRQLLPGKAPKLNVVGKEATQPAAVASPSAPLTQGATARRTGPAK
jgi:hypothetical protein